jgi:methionine-rich copper-binding protein CopC
MRRLIVAVVGCTLAVSAVTATVAGAHATLESSSPAAGAMLTELPAEIELTFSESVGKPAEMVVLDPSGEPVPVGELTLVDGTATLPLTSTTGMPGNYTVSYEVTSADGHPISGTVAFMVHGDGSGAVDPGAGTPDTGRDADPLVVGALAGALAIALAAAFVAMRRIVSR